MFWLPIFRHCLLLSVFEALGSSQLEYFFLFLCFRKGLDRITDLCVVWLVQRNFKKKHNAGLVIGFELKMLLVYKCLFVHNLYYVLAI